MSDKILEWTMVYIAATVTLAVFVLSFANPVALVLVVPAVSVLVIWTRTALGKD